MTVPFVPVAVPEPAAATAAFLVRPYSEAMASSPDSSAVAANSCLAM